jgi:hypothetical protein
MRKSASDKQRYSRYSYGDPTPAVPAVPVKTFANVWKNFFTNRLSVPIPGAVYKGFERML